MVSVTWMAILMALVQSTCALRDSKAVEVAEHQAEQDSKTSMNLSIGALMNSWTTSPDSAPWPGIRYFDEFIFFCKDVIPQLAVVVDGESDFGVIEVGGDVRVECSIYCTTRKVDYKLSLTGFDFSQIVEGDSISKYDRLHQLHKNTDHGLHLNIKRRHILFLPDKWRPNHLLKVTLSGRSEMTDDVSGAVLRYTKAYLLMMGDFAERLSESQNDKTIREAEEYVSRFSQSSTAHDGHARNLAKYFWSGTYSDGGCTHTEEQWRPWLEF